MDAHNSDYLSPVFSDPDSVISSLSQIDELLTENSRVHPVAELLHKRDQCFGVRRKSRSDDKSRHASS